ncbi:MAG: DUF3179 domain-containing protein [Paracoccaceae bacterium]
MPIPRRSFALLLAALMLFPLHINAQEPDLLTVQQAVMYGTPTERAKALETIRNRDNPDMAAGLIQALKFTRGAQTPITQTLSEITGENAGQTWFDWMLWQENNPQITPHPTFIDLKRNLLLRIDPNFDVFLKPKHLQPDRMKIRLEEITWGGVHKDGIPALDNPTMIPAKDATYMNPDDLIFGVAINGDIRAYPLRIMGWHEMFNEVIGGVPVALAYCTLCGSGILFEPRTPNRPNPFIFGSSGFLYRSNKLMFDRTTHSLWNQFTGKPVSGPLVDSGIELVQRPVVITTWAEWQSANPTTTILSQQTGYDRDYGSGVVYNAYFASDDLMFPAQVDQSQHKQKDYVFGIRKFGGAKAWPLKAFATKHVLNDAILDTNLVLIGDAKTRTVRAYERQNLTFDADLIADGTQWTATEDALTAPDGRQLPRVAGHIAYWFAWNGYLGAESELYEVPAN